MSIKGPKKTMKSRPTSPVHLHVDKDTAVHLYVDREEENDKISSYENNDKTSRHNRPKKPGINIPTSKLMNKSRTTSKSRLRSVSPPWVPPPGKSTKVAARGSGLGPFWSEEEVDLSQQDRYERQIQSLLTEVCELKGQLHLEQQDHTQGEDENDSAGQDELQERKQELDMAEKERLREGCPGGVSELVPLLIETELAAERCHHQMRHFFDGLCGILSPGHKVTERDVERLGSVVQEADARVFELTHTSEQCRHAVQRAQHMYRQADTNTGLIEDAAAATDLLEKELTQTHAALQETRSQLAARHEESLGVNTTQAALESLKGHLQQQLRLKSADCNRMGVQIRTLENELAKERVDKEQLLQMLRDPSGGPGSRDDRETLKKAARAQKQRALKAEEGVHELTAVLADRDRLIEQLQMDSHEDQIRLGRMDNLAEENQILYDKLGSKDEDRNVVALKRENENLRSVADECESRLHQVEQEMMVMRESLVVDDKLDVAGNDGRENRWNTESDTGESREQQLDKLARLVEKLETAEREQRNSRDRADDLERKKRSLETQTSEMRATLQEKDAAAMDQRCRLDDLNRENASLMRQLETALLDAKRNKELTQDRSVGRERGTQSRLHDLETELAQQRAEAVKWRHSSDEIERRCDSRLQDIRLQLEQAERTNHSLQTYVQFLKKSYANVFGDMPTLGTFAPSAMATRPI